MLYLPSDYFNPRSREGSDPRRRQHPDGRRDFNPRSREGSDSALKSMAKGATDFNPRSREGSDRGRYLFNHTGGDFNPRSREGSDHAPLACGIVVASFQSTLPRGERLPANTIQAIGKNFNPRSREGSDSKSDSSHDKSALLIMQNNKILQTYYIHFNFYEHYLTL